MILNLKSIIIGTLALAGQKKNFNHNMLFSLIIPAYKVEPFIEKCLKSVIGQKGVSHEDYEIIVIDDGSPDKSGEIAESILTDIENAHVVHQSNGGLSMARNVGLQFARGEYVWFIDSDDWIADDALCILKKQIEETNHPDVIMFQAVLAYENSQLKPYLNNFHSTGNVSITGKEVLVSGNWATCVQFYLFKQSFLKQNKLEFFPRIYHEDNEFTPRMILKARTVVQTNKVLYHKLICQGSITQTPSYKRVTDMIEVCRSLDSFHRKEDYENTVAKKLSAFIGLTLNNAFYLVDNHFNDRKRDFNKLVNENRNLLKHLKNSGVKKYQIEYILFSLTGNYSGVYSLLSKFK